jgi:hypothetical protein
MVRVSRATAPLCANPLVNPLFEAAAEVQSLCKSQAWAFCFIGGLAVLRWGEPRLTRDIDLTILTGWGGESPVIESLLEQFKPRINDAGQFALKNRVVLVSTANGTPVDVALGAVDFEKHAVARATSWAAGGTSLLTCSAEDLVVHKVFAGRERDWADVEGIIARQGRGLDRALIIEELSPLVALKGRGGDLDRLRAMLAKAP